MKILLRLRSRGEHACHHVPRDHSQDLLHHGEVFEVVVRLEKGLTCHQLDNDAAQAPDVAREGPTEAEHDLGSPVVPGRHDLRVVLVVKGRGPKVDQVKVRLLRNSRASPRPAARRNLAVLVVREQDVLRLQVRVNEADGVQELDGLQHLPRESLDVVQVKRLVPVLPQQVKEAHAKLRKHDADVSPVVEPLLELDAVGAALEVALLLPHRVQDRQLNHSRTSVLWNVPYHFDGDVLLLQPVPALDDLPESPLAEVAEDLVPLGEVLAQFVLVVAVLVVRPVGRGHLLPQAAVRGVRSRRRLGRQFPQVRGLHLHLPALGGNLPLPQAAPPPGLEGLGLPRARPRPLAPALASVPIPRPLPCPDPRPARVNLFPSSPLPGRVSSLTPTGGALVLALVPLLHRSPLPPRQNATVPRSPILGPAATIQACHLPTSARQRSRGNNSGVPGPRLR
mmetsp:Transcript_1290/g.3744  ORF Transcript_1290/g.3744 Transcript_1290/m.3744 type:complete len:451 (+) Transcript_1290:1127-2479(+)